MSGGSPPLRWVSIALGSKGLACDGPPFMNRKMMRFARAGKSVGFGASGPAAPGRPGERCAPGRGSRGKTSKTGQTAARPCYRGDRARSRGLAPLGRRRSVCVDSRRENMRGRSDRPAIGPPPRRIACQAVQRVGLSGPGRSCGGSGVPLLLIPALQRVLAQHVVDQAELPLELLPHGLGPALALLLLVFIRDVMQEEAEVALAEVRVVAREHQEGVPHLVELGDLRGHGTRDVLAETAAAKVQPLERLLKDLLGLFP